MAELTEDEIDAALERGRTARLHEPRATAARYDRRSRRVVVNLVDGCVFAFPAKLAEGLEAATEEQLSRVTLLGAGSGLHWEALDADLSVPGLFAGLFGTKAHSARHAGRATASAKAPGASAKNVETGRVRQARKD